MHKNGGGGGVTITPRPLLRVDRPLSVNSSGSAAASGNGHKPVVAATPAGSASVRPKSASPSSTAYHRRSSSGSAGKNGFETAGLKISHCLPLVLSLSPPPSRSLFPRVCLCVFCLYVHLCVSVCVKLCAVYAFLFLQTFRNCYRLVLLVIFVWRDPPADGQDPRPRDVAHRDAAVCF